MRNVQIVWMLLTSSLLVTGPGTRQVQEDAPLQVRGEKLTDRVLIVRAGRTATPPNMIAIRYDKGIVLIDSNFSPSTARRARELIEKEFGRSPFTHLIFSHAGIDHLGGSQVFAEAIRIGQENSVREVEEFRTMLSSGALSDLIDSRISFLQRRISEVQPSVFSEARLQETLVYWTGLREWLNPEFHLLAPKVTFSDELTLKLEGLTVQLRYLGPGYSTSDILIHVPETRLLMTGETFVQGWVPILKEDSDIPRLLSRTEEFLAEDCPVDHFLGAHGQPLSREDVRARWQYIHDLWDKVSAAVSEGRSLEDVKRELEFTEAFPRLIGVSTEWPASSVDLHVRNIEQLWKKARSESRRFSGAKDLDAATCGLTR